MNTKSKFINRKKQSLPLGFWVCLIALWIGLVGIYLVEEAFFIVSGSMVFIATILVFFNRTWAQAVVGVLLVLSSVQLLRISPVTNVLSLGTDEYNLGLELISFALLLLYAYPHRQRVMDWIKG